MDFCFTFLVHFSTLTKVSGREGLHIGADLLDHTDVLVSHHLVVGGLNPAIGPQVRAADAGRGKLDDRVGGLDDLRVFTLLDPDVASGIHDYATHLVAPFTSSRFISLAVRFRELMAD